MSKFGNLIYAVKGAVIEGPPATPNADALYKSALSILLVPVGVMDEFPVQLLRLLGLELLPAIWALENTIRLDPDIDHRAVAGLGRCGNLHRLGHCESGEAGRKTIQAKQFPM